ncbi:MAG: class I SAM-dependent methyltransferase [Actinomycetes bacterium]
MLPYRAYVSLLKTTTGQRVHRARLRRQNGWPRKKLAEDFVREYAAGRSFADIGGMYNIHGAISFLAEESGATDVTLVDVLKPPAFDDKHRERSSKVRFVHGSADDPEVLAEVGPHDVVWCWGVLYHHPNPYQLLAALRTICTGTLLLETLTIPDNPAVPNTAVYYPYSGERGHQLWTTHKGASRQYGITEEIVPHLEYVNNFWGLSPSCVRSLLNTAGFTVESWGSRPWRQLPGTYVTFRHLFIAKPTHDPVVAPFGPPATVPH